MPSVVAPVEQDGFLLCPRCGERLIRELRTVLELELSCCWCGYGWYGEVLDPSLPDGMRLEDSRLHRRRVRK